MNKILARLEDKTFRYVFQENDADFETVNRTYGEKMPELTSENTFEFTPERRLEPGEWYYITLDSERIIEILNPFFNTVNNSVSIDEIGQGDYSKIRALLMMKETPEGKKTIVLTRVFPRFYTFSKKLLKWGNGPKVENQSDSVDITCSIDAYWDGEKLYFHSFEVAKPLLPGLEDFYRPATEEEKADFLEKPIFDSSSFEKSNIKGRNLKRIAAIIKENSINWDDIEIRKSYLDYAKLYGDKYEHLRVDITENGQIKLDTNKDLTNALNILEERMYTTPITKKDMEAHSVIPLSANE